MVSQAHVCDVTNATPNTRIITKIALFIPKPPFCELEPFYQPSHALNFGARPSLSRGPPLYSFKAPTPFLEAMCEAKSETREELGFDLIVLDVCSASRAKKNV